MKKYQVWFVIKFFYTVDADSEDDAIEKAHDMYSAEGTISQIADPDITVEETNDDQQETPDQN